MNDNHLWFRAVYGWMKQLTSVPGTEPPCIPPWKRGEFFFRSGSSPFSKGELVGVLPLQKRYAQSRTARAAALPIGFVSSFWLETVLDSEGKSSRLTPDWLRFVVLRRDIFWGRFECGGLRPFCSDVAGCVRLEGCAKLPAGGRSAFEAGRCPTSVGLRRGSVRRLR